jgi:L-amino acid N-acyltransferase YncA
MITYQVEPYEGCIDEIKPYYVAHYDELSVTKTYPLDPDYEAYLTLARAGLLKVVTCRKDGALVGYMYFILARNLHYKTMLVAAEDLYYLDKAERKGRVGLDMFKFAERYLKEIGVNRVVFTTKVHLDNSSLFKYLKYTFVEKLYSKIL